MATMQVTGETQNLTHRHPKTPHNWQARLHHGNYPTCKIVLLFFGIGHIIFQDCRIIKRDCLFEVQVRRTTW